MWIQLDVDIREHPKFLKLIRLTNWSEDEAVGKLTRLWCWCAKHAPDGDLRPFGMSAINAILLLPRRHRVLIACQLVDTSPYLRIHDWWQYFGRFLQIKYKDRPDKWLQIRVKCERIVTDGVTDTVTEVSTDTVTRRTLDNGDKKTLLHKEMETATLEGSPPAPLAGAAAPQHPENCACEVCWKKTMDPYGISKWRK
jgi:hypothetical protein